MLSLERLLKLSVAFAEVWLAAGSFAHAEVASIYGGSDGLCGHPTASGERLNCAAMTAAQRTLPFGTLVQVCHSDASSCGSTTEDLSYAAGISICHPPRHERSD